MGIAYKDGARGGTVLGRPMLPDGPSWNLRGNGDMHTTTGDIFRWHVALRGEALLPAAQKRELMTGHVDEGTATGSRYAYGWAVTQTPRKTTLVSHTGGNGIISADFRRYVDDDV